MKKIRNFIHFKHYNTLFLMVLLPVIFSYATVAPAITSAVIDFAGDLLNTSAKNHYPEYAVILKMF